MIKIIPKIVLSDGVEVELNYDKLLSAEFNRRSRSNTDLPSWGIISNDGRLEFYDRYGKFGQYADEHKLDTKAKIKIALKNTHGIEAETVIGDFLASKWSYDSQKSTVNLSFTDGLTAMQNIKNNGMLFSSSNRNGNALLIHSWLNKQTAQSLGIGAFTKGEATSLLENIVIPYPYISSGNLWEQWDKFAKATACYVYKETINGQSLLVMNTEVGLW